MNSPLFRGLFTLAASALVFSATGTVAAQLVPPAGPNSPQSQMPNLTQVYEKLTTGSTTPIQTGFVGPSSGPDTPTMHSLNDIMGKMPSLDNASCAKPSDVLNGKHYWGLCSDSWGPKVGTASSIAPAPSGPPAPVAATGQTTSYVSGDDGDKHSGVAWPDPRFADNTDGTVTDNLTGLTWLKNANCSANLGGVNKTSTINWANALAWSGALSSGSCGLSDGSAAGDWRLPNIRELRSIIDHGATSAPRLTPGHPFTGVVSSNYWSSSTYAPGTSNAWLVYLNLGYTIYRGKTNDNYVWPVR